MKLSSETIRKLLKSVQSTRDQEIDCGHCHDEVDKFIEMQLEGKNVQEAKPLVQEHLDRCQACREEYEALLKALEAMAD